ncbi:hypothetical protein HAX54_052107, partial [Datura stramonium]|nr:hypothetical protein [Datura stramonium]
MTYRMCKVDSLRNDGLAMTSRDEKFREVKNDLACNDWSPRFMVTTNDSWWL